MTYHGNSISTCRFLSVLIACFLFIFLFWPTAVAAGDDMRPWAGLEKMLQREGVEIDTDSLVALVRENESRYIATAIAILGFRGDEGAEPVLLDTLRSHEDLFLREAAALALTRRGNAQGLEALRGFVQSSDIWHQQLHLAARLAEFGDLSGFPYIAAASVSEDPKKRFASMDGLAMSAPFDGSNYGGVEIDPVRRLIALGRDEDREIRFQFLVQIGMANYKGANPEVFRAVVEEMAGGDPDDQIKEWASRILRSGMLSRYARGNRSRSQGDDND